MKKSLVAVVFASFFLFVLILSAQGDQAGWLRPQNHDPVSGEGLQLALGVSPDVPYVSTPYEIVSEMIRLADVKAGDVVYDLGCGDGRLVIEAVKRTGCRGVGIDIDPERIKESRANAKAAGVEDRVSFVEQNFFVSDIRAATVMLIYLFPDINIRLRSKFLSEMKPGSRLVSHSFDMGDWRPDVTSNVLAQRVYLWVIPANVTGTWRWTAPGKGKSLCTLEVDQRYQQIQGTLSRGGEKTALADARVAGDRIAFSIEEEANGAKTIREFAGTVKGNTLTGTIVSRHGAGAQNRRWRAVRDPSTQHPIETGYQRSDLLWY